MDIASRIRALSGWRRRLVLLLSGAVAALALPPLHLYPVLLACFPVLVWSWDAAPDRKAAFGAGWWWTMGWFAMGFYWLANALLTDAARFGWMIPFAVFGISGVVAAFFGAATWAARVIGARGPGRIAVLAVAWTLAEWLRSWVMTGFPWNPLGSVWDFSLPVLQAGALVGIWGLTLMTALGVMAPALLADKPGLKRRLMAAFLALGLPGLAWVAGSWRLSGAPDPTDPASYQPGVRLRLVQGATNQASKWKDELREANLRELVALSRAPGFEQVTTVIWSETAAPYFLDLDPMHRTMAAAAAPAGGFLLTGAPRITPREVQPVQIWNSLMAITADAKVEAVYDKVHLVPFGEYVPFKGILPIAKITHGGTDFSPGPGPRTLSVEGLPPFSPLICYEAIFPAAVVDPQGKRPAWLLTITNDGWFGRSAAPYQHLTAARMRAIEEGLPLVRVANTGISAVFDAYGRPVARLGLGEKGSVDSPLPKPTDITPFGRFGNATAFIVMLVCLHVGTWRRRR